MLCAVHSNGFSRKSRPDLLNKEMHTPFLCAAIRGYKEICEVLIKAKVSIMDVDASGKNFIHIAAESNHAKFLEVTKIGILSLYSSLIFSP